MMIPRFSDPPRKNDALFLYGASRPTPFVLSYPQKKREVVHGPACSPEREIRLDRCRRDNVPVQRRRTGGGTVVLAPGMAVIIVVDVRPPEASAVRLFARIHQAVIRLLDPDGAMNLQLRGISDIAAGNAKVLGSSMYLGRRPDLYYYQSSLLVRGNAALMDRYLCHPPREPSYRKGRRHAEFCTTLQDRGFGADVEQVCGMINASLPDMLHRISREQDARLPDTRSMEQ